jgi:hypothetical protein
MVVSMERLTDANRLAVCTFVPLRVIAGHGGTRATPFVVSLRTNFEPGGMYPAGLSRPHSVDWRRLADQLRQDLDRQE